jgi:nicotinate-nucleotide adenylyltransferase
MCQLLGEGSRGVSASALEVERGGASYTVDTLKAVHDMHPEARLTFIMGADTACTLGSWHEPAHLLELAELAVATRSGASRREVLATVAAIADPPRSESADGGVHFLEMGPIEVSSSLVRERVARGEAIEELVGPAVAEYIAAQDLYRTPIEAAS